MVSVYERMQIRNKRRQKAIQINEKKKIKRENQNRTESKSAYKEKNYICKSIKKDECKQYELTGRNTNKNLSLPRDNQRNEETKSKRRDNKENESRHKRY